MNKSKKEIRIEWGKKMTEQPSGGPQMEWAPFCLLNISNSLNRFNAIKKEMKKKKE